MTSKYLRLWHRPVVISVGLILLAWAWGSWHILPVIRSYLDHPPNFDESVHLLPVQQIANDVRSGRVVDFWFHTYTQDRLALYPFFHSWIAAPFFLFSKSDLFTGRASGLFFLGTSVVIGFFLARELAYQERWPWLAGLVGAGLLLTALPLWVYASITYLEAPGLAVTLFSLFCYARANPDRPSSIRWTVSASVSAACALFTKYSFGIFVVGGIIAAETIGMLALRRWPSRRRIIGLVGPFAILTLIWFADIDKLHRFLAYSHSQSANIEMWSTASLLYYPICLTQHYVFGPLSLFIMLGGLAMGVRTLRLHAFRAVTAYLLVSLVLLTLVPQKGTRFAYTVAPAALLLAGPFVQRGMAWLVDCWPQRSWRWLLVALGAASVGLEAQAVVHRFTFLRPALEVVYTSSPDTHQAYQFVIENTLAQGRRLHILNGWHLFSHYALAFEYYAATGDTPALVNDPLVTTGFAPEPTPASLENLAQTLLQQGTSVLVSIDGSPAGRYTGWQVIEPLWANGWIEPLASSTTYTLIEWPMEYRERIFAGDFATQDELEQTRRKSRTEFSIQVHLYCLQGP